MGNAGASRASAQTELFRRDGGRFAALIGAARLEGADEGIAFVLDVTRQKQLEAQFLQAQKMETVGRLASGVAHDFNNLLTAIGSFAQLAWEDVPEDSLVRGHLEQVMNATKRAAGLTSKLLAFARQQVVQPVVLNPGDVLKEMQKILSRLVRANIQFQISSQPDVGCLKADATQFEQVIVNLVVNSIDAMPQGGKLTLSTCNRDVTAPLETRGGTVPPGSYVALRIEDTGSGMAEETLNHLFEPFFTTKPVGQGTGLGLAMVYGVVAQASGHIIVSSEVKVGTTFEILFPRVPPPEATAAGKLMKADARRATHVLLVEDQEDVRRAIARLMQAYGYKVEVAVDAEEALQVLERNDQIQVLVTDVVLPGMDGKQLAVTATRLRPQLKTLLVSGYNEVVTEADFATRSFAYLRKPFSGKALVEKLSELLSSSNTDAGHS
jgi:two-component system cell cycle sensor histidine kinase/response regulator CckA